MIDRPRTGFVRSSLLAAMCTAAAACDVAYLARAAVVESRLLWNRQLIATVVQRPSIAPDLKQKLQTVLAVREFARDRLALNVGGAYQAVTDVDQSAVVWVVIAAPLDALQPYTWWFPIVGALPYRGYFDQADARAEAASLKSRGYDTLVRPVIAFSSLGWFNDPLGSNLLSLSRVELAGVIIHELFHRTFFLPGEAIFNESAATYVGSRGAVEFFAASAGARSPEADEAREIVRSQIEFSKFLLRHKARLLAIYTGGLARDEILERREAAFALIKKEWTEVAPSMRGMSLFDLGNVEINNAVLVSYLLYFEDLPNFAALERANRGDLRATVLQIIDLANSKPRHPFYALWEASLNAPPVAPPDHLGARSAPAIAADSSPSNPPKK
ncbi:MAG: aminopeptidase [Candidatus Binataceae bacterium]